MYLVRHEGGEGASDLVVVHVILAGAQQDEEEAHGDRHLQHRLQQHRLVQPDEGHGRLLQELHATWPHAEGVGWSEALLFKGTAWRIASICTG